ncbi:MAG: prepilin-type N-terminal cleavage/methylation domain-containing protein [Paludisphaera borealis]|uniref:prepilin-type N-terminal cleavage/methylation domain-containing protein n=1 Tax=Paludisphaera borealis TaxID=1387353 RepID=UPI0028404E60|nr:prepilin-type N-terminal cleavage/methylation domain-containing protein [Paludisphaera borealis]MDR3620332.1 prepilin-type N-terminal cleavage/methylation domain-containing protein [Paludisphaera borealis]
MKPTAVDPRRLRPSRRGITLVEMLVTVAVLVLLMTILVQIFQAATGSLSSAQSYQELDNSLRRLDAMVRSDLNGVTARLTPPLNPKDGLGYLEYGENAFADIQGEDSDDYIRFTAKAPPGRPFRGRVLLKPPVNSNTAPVDDPSNLTSAQLSLYTNNQPILITSDFAEIIYFLRNGNLYRRVLLIAPERQSSIVQMTGNTIPAAQTGWAKNVVFTPGAFGGNAQVSWQGVNDLSARPGSSGPIGGAFSHIVLNTLGDLTNRENRAFYQRFSDDYINNATLAVGPDGIADDSNNDGVPDFYPTLYTDSTGAFTTALAPLTLIFAPGYAKPTGGRFSSMAFPYIFPGAYTQPETDISFPKVGWIHSPTPDQNTNRFSNGSASALLYLQRLNHNPLDLGDNLYRPIASDGTFQTWWGFPTSRETLSVGWLDPTWQLNLNGGVQAPGLNPRDPTNVNGGVLKVVDDLELLPPMTGMMAALPTPVPVRLNPQLYSDDFGTASTFITNYGKVDAAGNISLWPYVGEDDLIMTGVRSFDIKAYDDLYAGYVDLGWKNDVRMDGNIPEFNRSTDNTQSYNFLSGTPSKAYSPFAGSPYTDGPTGLNGRPFVGARSMPTLSTFGHEGRMPPLLGDFRSDAQFPVGYYPGPTFSSYPIDGNGVTNLGDDAPNINRLRRVFDTWSTDYSVAPAHAVDPTTGTVYGPPFTPPVYPSYPPPYPAPLKGIQIQVRVVDPTNQRIKQVTIRHDFTDRL